MTQSQGAEGDVILIVDDDPDIRRLTTSGLRSRGFRTLEAENGTIALTIIDDGDVDLVLLDAGLPDLDGTEVLTRLRSSYRTATLPVIMVTGRSGLGDRVHGLAAGADDYVAKPVALDELVARIEANLRGQRVWIDRMTQRLRERAQLAAELATNAASFMDVVRHVVGTIGAQPLVAAAAIVEISSTGHATLLATSGKPGTVDSTIAAELDRLSSAGASIVAGEVGSGLFGPDSGTLVAAMLAAAATVDHALVVEVDPAAPNQRTAVREMLGLVVELVPMIENMLASRRAADDTLLVAADIVEVIESAAYWPVFQPITDIVEGRCVGYEALTRFDDGTPPNRRFADARRAGVGDLLELATLRAAIETARSLPGGRSLSVNVSASLLAHPDLTTILNDAGDRPMCVELTEHEQIDDYDRTRSDVARLGPNVRLSVDDAGSGWASLRHVLTLRPDFVKLDRSWVADIQIDPARQALLLGIARFVDEIGGHVIAEGVEQHAELAALRSVGIRLAQGYLLGRPARVADLRERT